MTTITKKDRLNRLSALLKALPEKELKMVEAMLSTAQASPTVVEPSPEIEPEDTFEKVSVSSQGKKLLELLKKLQKTKIEFKLTQLKSLKTPINVEWEVQDPEFNMLVMGSGRDDDFTQSLIDEVADNIDLAPARIAQDMEKDRGKMETLLESIGKKKYSFYLNEVPSLQQVTIVMDFEALNVGNDDSVSNENPVSFTPDMDWQEKGKTLSSFYYDGAFDSLCENYDYVADNVPEEIASQFREVNSLSNEINLAIKAVTKAYPTLSYADVVDEFCFHTIKKQKK